MKTFSGKKILIVEDYYVNQEVITDILELMGCTVILAENGKEALEKMNEDNFDLIFMDVQMPEMDGFTATRAIREKKNNIPIVALTANALQGDREKCLDSGMDDYLSKPIETKKIETILTKFLG